MFISGINNIIKGNSLLITTISIIPVTLYSGDGTIILPTILFLGIMCGLIKNGDIKETLMTSLIAFLIGSVLTFILSLIVVFYSEGALYAISLVHYSVIYIIIFTIIGIIGSSLGYYVREKIKE